MFACNTTRRLVTPGWHGKFTCRALPGEYRMPEEQREEAVRHMCRGCMEAGARSRQRKLEHGLHHRLPAHKAASLRKRCASRNAARRASPGARHALQFHADVLAGWVNSSGCLPSQRRGCSVFLIINLLMQVLGPLQCS